MQTETTMFTGGGSQTRTLNRWGDYSEVSIDPADDCTFWYANEYLPSNGTFNWSTRIGSFKFSGCTSSGSPPPAPTGLTPTAGVGQVALSWNSSTGATGYEVFRGTSPGGESSTAIANPTGTTYTDTTVTAGTTYYYYVKANNSAGDSPPSNEVSATPAPPAPTGLTPTAGAGQVALSWNSSTGATGYKVFRGTSPGGESSTPIASPTGTSYIDMSVTAGTKYYYYVKANNSAGDSPPSSEVSATPTAATSYASTVLATSGLVSYWRLDETSGTTANDQTGANTGTYVGAHTLNQPGAIANDSDTAVKLSGGYVSIPAASSLRPSSVTIEGWFNLAAVGYGRLFSASGGVYLEVDSSNHLLFSYKGTDGNQHTVTSSTVLSTGTWYYLVGTVDSSGNERLYVNGAQDSSLTTGLAIQWDNYGAAIGAYSDGSGGFLNGTVDEIAVYNTALSATTIQNHYNVGVGI
jgi:hypothetical protein